MNSRTGAQILVDQLGIHGTRRIFCVPGESYLAVLDALHDVRNEIELIVNRQEGGACFMAEAYGKLTGEPGICFVTRGPGATNASIGVHHAQQESTPLILFIGQVGNDFVEREAFQEVDYRRMFGPLCKWVAQIDRADRVPEYIARAFQVATSGRPGPVVLALPEDMLSAVASVADCAHYTPVQAAPQPHDLQQLEKLLAQAQRPFVILGGSGWNPAACKAFQQFAENHQVPVGCAFRYADLFGNHHPNYAGDVGIGINPALAKQIREADLILAVGARLGEMTTQGYVLLTAPKPTQTLIHIHNQPDELGRVYQADLMIASGMPQIAQALNQLPVPSRLNRESWLKTARAQYVAWQARPPVLAQQDFKLDCWQVVQTLKTQLPRDAIITNGAGNFATWANRFWPYCGFANGHRTQLAPSSGSMGVGVPAAISAKLQHPDCTVVCFAGDGDFLMTGQELATATQYEIGMVVLLFNNGMYGTIRMHQEREFPTRVHGTQLHNPDFAALAVAYGGAGWKVDATEQFPAALAAALQFAREKKRPALIELAIDPEMITPNTTITEMNKVAHQKN